MSTVSQPPARKGESDWIPLPFRRLYQYGLSEHVVDTLLAFFKRAKGIELPNKRKCRTFRLLPESFAAGFTVCNLQTMQETYESVAMKATHWLKMLTNNDGVLLNLLNGLRLDQNDVSLDISVDSTHRHLATLDVMLSLKTGSCWLARDHATGDVRSTLSNIPKQWFKSLSYRGQRLASVRFAEYDLLRLGLLARQDDGSEDADDFLLHAANASLCRAIGVTIGKSGHEINRHVADYLWSEPRKLSADANCFRRAIESVWPKVSRYHQALACNQSNWKLKMAEIGRKLTSDVVSDVFNTLPSDGFVGVLNDGLLVLNNDDAESTRDLLVNAAQNRFHVKPTVVIDSFGN